MVKKILLLITFFSGLSLLLYPTISQYWNTFTQSQAITDYDKILENSSTKDYSSLFTAATNYNQTLANLDFPLTQYKQLSNYSDLLNVNNNGMIGYISITKLKLELPIYHGTSSSILNIAVGHLEGSSLPIGGESTHSVLSAHRGLPSAKLFTNLNKLEIGDTFTITVLNQKLTYQVDKIITVEPVDVSQLEIIPGKDYVTLITCTPYGINTHRLLVRGTRIVNETTKDLIITSEAFKVNKLIVALVISLPILFTLFLYIIIKPTKKKREDEKYEEIFFDYNNSNNQPNNTN